MKFLTDTVKSFIGQAEIQTEACACSEHVHDFCTIFVVDGVFMTSQEVSEILSKHPHTGQKGPYSNCDKKSSDVAAADESASHTHNSALRTTPLDPISPILVEYVSVSPSEADVQEIAQFAVDELSRGAHSMASLVLVNVVKAEKQTLAGVNYRLKLELKSGDIGAMECDVVVFDQSCSSTCRVSSFKCNPPLNSSVSSTNEKELNRNMIL